MPKTESPRLVGSSVCSAAILDYPSKPGWWWGWYKSASRWYLINISHDDIDEGNVPPNYEFWIECVPPLPPNVKLRDAGESGVEST